VLTSLSRGGRDPGFHPLKGPFFLQYIPCSNFAAIDVLIIGVAVGSEGPDEVLEWRSHATFKEMFNVILEDSGWDFIVVRLSHDVIGDHEAFCVTASTDNSRNKVRTNMGDGPARSAIVELHNTSVPM
jgi:hypothetical protein